jgi:ABC-type Fe3+ transport system substrate-binding protein
MTRIVLAFGALLAVLVLPFVARSRRTLDRAFDQAAERLVIITPHNEPVRFEFDHAFREHMAREGRRIEIDWRTPGGTAEIGRFLISEYTASFQRHWTEDLGRPPGAGAPPTDEAAAARQAFLSSQVSAGLDLLFGGGSVDHIRHARAGRLVDSGVVAAHPELFGPQAIPHTLGGQVLWDSDGRWVGNCLATFGMCFNRDVLARLGVDPPATWGALADPRLLGQVALADPSKSGSAGKAFELIIQAAMQRAGVVEGWAQAIRLIRRIGGNARYFTDSAAKVALDVTSGDAAAGMCIDFYGRFQRESVAALGQARGKERVGYAAARGETAPDADPISLLRGAPHRALALRFIEFVLSDEGQKLWSFRPGTPGGPRRYGLSRLPIVPRLYGPEYERDRLELGENPYDQTGRLEYREALTGRLFGAIAFVVRAMCVDTEPELREAYGALAAAGFPPQATALFDDVSLIDHATVSGPILEALRSADPLPEAAWARRLVTHFRDLYRRTTALARQGR